MTENKNVKHFFGHRKTIKPLKKKFLKQEKN